MTQNQSRILAVVVLLAFPCTVEAASNQRVSLSVALSSYYDSNLLEYSSSQIALFESATLDILWKTLLHLTLYNHVICW